MFKKNEKILIKSSSIITIISVVIMLCLKSYGAIITDSKSILASTIDSLLDLSSSIINLIAIYITLQPPNTKHRFGYEKFQDIAVFVQSLFFILSSIFTFITGIKSLIYKTGVDNIDSGENIMLLSIAVNTLLVLYQHYVVKKTNSKIITTDKLHYLTDLLINIGIIISININSKFNFIDSIFAIIISVYIIHSASILFRQAIKNLSDEEFDEKERLLIVKTIIKHKNIKGIHELKTRYAGQKPFIQFHLEVDSSSTLKEAYILSKKITKDLLAKFHNAEILIHYQPIDSEEYINYKEQIGF